MEISKLDYDKLIRNKKLSDNLKEIQEDYYQKVVEILQCEDGNGWLVDYFYNDNVDIDMLLEKLNIDVEK